MQQPPGARRSKVTILAEPPGRVEPYQSLHLRLFPSRIVNELFALLSATQTVVIYCCKCGWDTNALSEPVNLSGRSLGMCQPKKPDSNSEAEVDRKYLGSQSWFTWKIQQS